MDKLTEALKDPQAYPHQTTGIDVVETHISVIFLTGTYAYKIKKPVDLGFLDFSTLEKRKHFCEEELRLNRRLCDELYLDVVPVTRKKDGTIRIGGSGEIVEYAVRMHQFNRDRELDRLLKSGQLHEEHIDSISAIVSGFHANLASSPPGSSYASPEIIGTTVLNNFKQLPKLPDLEQELPRLEHLQDWTVNEHKRLVPVFGERKRSGCIRQCHGDMHTGNMVLYNNTVCIFDCIEFNPNLSIIDTMSEVAFFIMDLEHHRSSGLSWRFLNDYLMEGGDYEGLKVLRFYMVYRAMVRAKVTAIRLSQEEAGPERNRTLQEHRSFITLAEQFRVQSRPLLLLMHGFSGSGKTTLARKLSSRIGAVHCRSDIERKRLFGLQALESSSDEQKAHIYSSEATRKTYQRLLKIASVALSEGYSVIVDATFLREAQRRLFVTLAGTIGCPIHILACAAPEKKLEERIRERSREADDASEADLQILHNQLEDHDPLSAAEEKITLHIDTTDLRATEKIVSQLDPDREKA